MIAFRPAATAMPQPVPIGLPEPRHGADVTSRMAETMRELAFAGRNVERAALFLEGFSLAEIDAHWEAAASIARQRAVRRVGGTS